VNPVPYNSVEGLEWERPIEARQQKFARAVRGGVSLLGHDSTRSTSYPKWDERT
jgi:hypothetical protein